MSQSQAALVRQLRADLAAAQARPTGLDQLLGTLSLAASVRFPVPNAPTICLHLGPHPDSRDQWCIVRFGWYEPASLHPDDGWVPLEDVAVRDQYPWTAEEALGQVPGLLEAEARAHAAWQKTHDLARRAGDLAVVVEELLEPVRTAVADGAVA